MSNRGFTLVEALVAMALLCVAALGGIQLVALATEMMWRARVHSTTAGLAAARLEQLRALQFEFDAAGLRLTDVSTNLADDPVSSGGAGLSPSGAASLESNVAGYVDFLDRHGTSLGTGTSAPPGTAFVRRWSIDPLGGSADLLVLQVLVRPVAAGSVPGASRVAGDARLVTLRARTRR